LTYIWLCQVMRRLCWILKFTCVLFHHFSLFLIGLIQQDKQNMPWYIVTMQEKWNGQKKLTTNQIVQDLVTWYTLFLLLQESCSGAKHKEIEVQKNLKEIQHVCSIFCFNDSCNVDLSEEMSTLFVLFRIAIKIK
jgi:hypothetical protein